ncbi:hypothetical protein Ae263Ps1_1551c [Pseudonocardia sp. Ae263_Ps1]|nr:hypothetical protein Ae263Ps1_0578c [Pseudonocardia sp. Ae263_Ps1]OLL84496.1 hypothetical protein Ae263Ps1_1551c [Pseudonocardia sp. Ae263_Ps1]OLL90438.1 hypothetical protein Ae356Ps1_0335 [Pseudonocardia sp. Ae356_Ps1]OLL95484.1 hypothetical protein Ae356Ps1_5381 [Pseudonocardia sp. Ae356_Ps1]
MGMSLFPLEPCAFRGTRRSGGPPRPGSGRRTRCFCP